jgi:hypothetical protein
LIKQKIPVFLIAYCDAPNSSLSSNFFSTDWVGWVNSPVMSQAVQICDPASQARVCWEGGDSCEGTGSKEAEEDVLLGLATNGFGEGL